MSYKKCVPLECCRSLVLLERLLYLNNIEPQHLALPNLLDRHQHQTILRLYYEKNQSAFFDKLQLYYSSYQERLELLKEIISLTKEELYEHFPYYKDFIKINNEINLVEARKKITDEFKKIIEDSPLNQELYFANKFGFAIFPELKVEPAEYGLIAKILDTQFTSVGGLMYYGFNFRDHPIYYYQILPIEVLTATLYLYAKETSPITASKEWWAMSVYKEMSSLPESFKNHRALSKLTLEVLELHEQGHSLCVNGDMSLYHFLKTLGVKDQDIYKTEFATDDDLKSWERIKEGSCSPKDVCFLLGDFLANISALLAGMSEQTVLIMRAFNWGISMPPSPNRRPRGKISFLRYSLDKDFEHLFSKLEKIFIAAKKYPKETRQAIQEMELESWHKLEEYYNVNF